MYDALYKFSRMEATTRPPRPRVLFVCLHRAAKSVIGAAHFRRLAAARGLSFEAVAAGTEPDPTLAPEGGERAGRRRAHHGAGSPTPVTLYDLVSAARVVSFGCDIRPARGSASISGRCRRAMATRRRVSASSPTSSVSSTSSRARADVPLRHLGFAGARSREG
jgi:hypothetical protein